MTKASTTKAARALVAYFTHDLATQLARRVLKEKSTEAWKNLADCILAQVPKAVGDRVWPTVVRYVDSATVQYMATEAYKAKVAEVVKANADAWIRQAVDQVIKTKANDAAQKAMSHYSLTDYVKGLAAKYQGLVDAELGSLARSRAAEIAGAAK